MKKHVYTICVIAAALFMALMSFLDPLYSVDTYITDHVYSRLNGTDPRIVIVGIDEETLNEYGNFTVWSRGKLAELIDKLYEDEENAPAVVGLDFILTDKLNEADDAALASAASKEGRDVIVGTNIVYRGQLETDSKGRRFYNTEHVANIEMPYDELNEAAYSGFTNACIASDGYVRHSMNKISVPEELKDKASDTHESLAFAIYKTYQEKHGNRVNEPPTNSSGQFRFLYSGESGEYSEVSLRAVLSDKVPMSAFKDAIVMVGAYAPGFQDSYQPASDRGRTMYGVEIHANIIQAYMQSKTLLSLNRFEMAFITALIAALFALLLRKKGPSVIIIASLAISVAYLLLGRFLAGKGVYIQCAYVILFMIIADVYFIFEKYVVERIRRRHTLDVFKKYVAPQVVDELSHTGDFELHLGGEKRDIAVLFVDIRGFTSMSELLEPEQVVEILNEYLKHVTDCVLSHNGTLDKFIGDAAMAIFNAPFDLGYYVYQAVATAWDISRGTQKLEKQLEEKFGRTIKFGVGVNCGPAIVGNIGCDFRMDYTAIGDTVNTSARLESNAKAGQILISEDVYNKLKGRIEAESVGEIPLKGKSNKIEIFSVVKLNKEEGKNDESKMVDNT